jgi:hypothetical protein
VNLQVPLQMVECLEYNLHELIVVGFVIAGLTFAWIVPCVHHRRDF